MGSGQLSGEKKAISDKIDSMREGLVSLSHDIHGHPETGFQEYHAVEAIEAFLKGQGMVMERDYCQIPTAFRAVKKGRGKGPVVAFLAEYDALRGIGHGCGHNVIAACAVGAFLGLASRMEAHDGEIWLIGTPAEEGGAGKVLMLERGGFDGVDFALMMHPTGGGEAYNYMNRGGRASGSVTVSFHGKAAHSSTPASGINALNAAISVFNQIDMLRPAFQIQDNINGVILDGGTAGNIIPEFSRCEFCIRAETMKRAEELIGLIKGCVKRAEELTGAWAEIETEPIYAERYPCLPMCEAFRDNMGLLGISMCEPRPGELFGSSDIGNVSIRIPAIHDYLSITDDASIEAHSSGYARAAAGPEADRICILGAEGLAMTGLDLLEDKGLREKSIAYHKKTVPSFYGKIEKGNYN